MKIKAMVKNKEIEIELPSSEYWMKRNKQRINSYWNQADNLEKRIIKEYEKAYKELEKELYTFVGKFGTDGKLTYSQNRIIQLMKEIKPHIDVLYDNEQISLTELLTSLYEDNYYKGLYEISKESNIAYSFVGLNERAIKAAISYPWQGINFSDSIWQEKNYLIYNLKKTITNGLIRGDSIEDMTRSLMYKELNKRTGKIVDKGPLGKAKYNARRLIQTETAQILSSSDNAMYKEFGLERFEFVATLDDRTSEICKSLDGKNFSIDEYEPGVNAPVLHPWERSTTVPYFDDNVGKRIAKDINTGKAEYISSDISYKEWYKKYVD